MPVNLKSIKEVLDSVQVGVSKVLDFCRGWVLWCFGSVTLFFWFYNVMAFIADDSYFYLVIARNFALGQDQTFNGLIPTNGFHPLWMYLLSVYNILVANLADARLLSQPTYAIVLSTGLLGIGTYNFWRIGKLLSFNSTLFSLIPLAYLSVFNVLYSEAHLYYFSLSWLTYLAIANKRRNYRHYIYIGIASAAVLLSRLDSVFFVAAFYLWYLLTHSKRSWVFVAGTITTILVIPYLISNLVFFGGLDPISGWVKSSFPSFSTERLLYLGQINLVLSGYHVLFGILPIVLAGLAILKLRRRIEGPTSIIIVYFLGSLAHFLYVALFVSSKTPWYWYFVLPVVLGALTIGLAAREFKRLRQFTPVAVAGIFAMSGALFVGYRSVQDLAPQAKWPLTYVVSNEISNSVIFVSDNPGTLAYYTTNHVIAADALMMNRRFFDNMVSSTNALEYIWTYVRSVGQQVDYVFYLGGLWISPSEDLESIVYYNPKLLASTAESSRFEEIGRIYLGEPLAVFPQQGINGEDFIVWRLDSSDLSWETILSD